MKTAQQRLEEAEAALAKAQRKARVALAEAIDARKAAGLAAQRAAPPQPSAPATDAFTDHLLTKAIGGDQGALELLKVRGADVPYIAQLRHTVATATSPGYRAWAAGQLAMLDESFDPDAPLPRGAGSPF